MKGHQPKRTREKTNEILSDFFSYDRVMKGGSLVTVVGYLSSDWTQLSRMIKTAKCQSKITKNLYISLTFSGVSGTKIEWHSFPIRKTKTHNLPHNNNNNCSNVFISDSYTTWYRHCKNCFLNFFSFKFFCLLKVSDDGLHVVLYILFQIK